MQLQAAADALAVRSLQDGIVLRASIISHVVNSEPGELITDQSIALQKYLAAGRQGFPNRYIDVLCNGVVFLERRARLGVLTKLEQGFALLLDSDESICNVFDFAFSDSSPTRFGANTKAHPLKSMDEMRTIVRRSVKGREAPTAVRCVVAMTLPFPESIEMQRKGEEEAARDVEKNKILNTNYVREGRHQQILKCLAHHRRLMETSPSSWDNLSLY